MNIVCADSETTGISVTDDRIVTFFAGVMNGSGEWIESREWLLNQPVDIPAEATAVHGVTNEKMRAEGTAPREGIREIIRFLEEHSINGAPLVLHNGSFDLSILHSEALRYRIKPFWPNNKVIVDTYVLDKAKDKWRKGSRKLVDVAAHYGIDVDPALAHEAMYDCELAGKIALKLLASWKKPLRDLMPYQEKAAREQRTSLEAYFKKSGKMDERTNRPIVVEQGWPVLDLVLTNV